MSVIIKGLQHIADDKEIAYLEINFLDSCGMPCENKIGCIVSVLNGVIEIPTPHGRLIDGDKLRETYSKWLDSVPYENNSFADMGRRDVLISINYDLTYSAPTILESEE